MEFACPNCLKLLGIDEDESGVYECPHCESSFEHTSSIDTWIYSHEKGESDQVYLISEHTRNDRRENMFTGILLIVFGSCFLLGWVFVLPALVGLWLIYGGVNILFMDSTTTKHVTVFDILESRIVSYTLKNEEIDRVRTNNVDTQSSCSIVTCSYWTGGNDTGYTAHEIYMTQRSGAVEISYPRLTPYHAKQFSEYLEISFTELDYKFESQVNRIELSKALKWNAAN